MSYYYGTEETDNHDHIGTEETDSNYPHGPINNGDDCPWWLPLTIPTIMILVVGGLIWYNS